MTNNNDERQSKWLIVTNIQALLWLALALALAGSLKHLAAIFASVDGNIWFGWLQAVAVDVGLFALAYSIKVRKSARRTTRPLWAGVLLFTGISVYGNLAYGVLSIEGTLWPWLEWPRPFVLAGTLPILVLFLAELISDDRQHAEAQAKRAAKRETAAAFDQDTLDNLDRANEAKRTKIVERRQEVRQHLDNGVSPTDIATALGVSRRTILRDIAAFEMTRPEDIPGTIGRNGK